MFKKHLLLLGVICALVLLGMATATYPGGSRADIHAAGFDWKNNYLTNLFQPQAVNGRYNIARYWAISGWLCLSLGFMAFFISFSKRIREKTPAAIVRYFGLAAMLAAFLAVTPLHDTAITVACTLGLVSTFYTMVYAMRARLLLPSIASVLCMLAAYAAMVVYYTQHFLEILPALQKTYLAAFVVWGLCLNYFTKKEDFIWKQKTKEAIKPL